MPRSETPSPTVETWDLLRRAAGEYLDSAGAPPSLTFEDGPWWGGLQLWLIDAAEEEIRERLGGDGLDE